MKNMNTEGEQWKKYWMFSKCGLVKNAEDILDSRA